MTNNPGFLQFRPPWNRHKVNNAEDLWEHFTNYVEHSNSTPLVEAKLFSTKTGLANGSLNRLRPLTVEAFCNYIGISARIWNSWKTKAVDNDDEFFHEVMEMIELNIQDHQFQGAATSFFNATMISRKLGLVEKTEVAAAQTQSDPSEGKEEHLAIHIHPDDPDPLDTPRPLYSLAQIEAGIGFTPPKHRLSIESDEQSE